MFGKRYHTILIMPSVPGKRTLRCILPVRAWVLFSILLSMLSALSAAGIWSLHHHVEANQRSIWLANQNRLALELLDAHIQRERSLSQELNRIREQATFVRGFLGLQSRGSGGKLGQGGAETDADRLMTHHGSGFAIHPGTQALSDRLFPVKEIPQEIAWLQQDLEQIIRTLETRQDAMEHTPSISPVDPRHSWISSQFGMRISPFTGKEQFHLGVDIAAWKGTPITATAKGRVVHVGKIGPLGLMVKIQHLQGLVTEYGHLLKATVKRGQSVNRGEVIGTMGDSGRSTGYHLHYGIKRDGDHVDPRAYMADWDRNAVLMAETDPVTTTRK